MHLIGESRRKLTGCQPTGLKVDPLRLAALVGARSERVSAQFVRFVV